MAFHQIAGLLHTLAPLGMWAPRKKSRRRNSRALLCILQPAGRKQRTARGQKAAADCAAPMPHEEDGTERSPLIGKQPPWEHEAPPPKYLALRLAFFSWGNYLCMYGMRKPWSALQYVGDPPLLGMNPKVAIAVAQIVGYFCGKLLGIWIVPRVTKRALVSVLIFIGCNCTLGWLGLYLLPRGVLTLLSVSVGSFPLAMVWSLVYRYIEGRRCSDAVGGAFGTSVILGPGVSKLAGSALASVCHSMGVSEWGVPFIATALFFLPGYVLCIWGLECCPPPTAAEISEMGDRTADNAGGRSGGSTFFKVLVSHWPGVLTVGVYNACMLAVREVRDVFQPELWQALYGHVPQPVTFLFTEIPSTLIVLFLCQRVGAIRSPHTALLLLHAMMLACGLMMPLLNVLRSLGIISGASWFMGLGASLSLGAVIVSSCFFDRVISALRSSSSAGVLIQAADMLGYIGTLTALYVVEKGEEEDAANALPVSPPPPPMAMNANLHLEGWQQVVTAQGDANRIGDRISGHAGVPAASMTTSLVQSAVRSIASRAVSAAALDSSESEDVVTAATVAMAQPNPQPNPQHMLQMVEGIFYAMGPASAVCVVISLLYWTRALREQRREVAD